ncbi:hypothetical protein BZG00_10570 [Salinivibrio kushneri]|uniref:Uncharacterized protein n=1 Tax=Salinivibrio kushneri TaxID=1908198 RepID=A0AB36JVY2_9GAMM|nr:hypothetical protein [Salinivibrio kushneri]OOE39324.1 hypothetical protein BZG00_10570 [Salinivibrio kushneri]QCP02444.1 hypothetical protein FCN78_08605 [Salinivibrio kushneri]
MDVIKHKSLYPLFIFLFVLFPTFPTYTKSGVYLGTFIPLIISTCFFIFICLKKKLLPRFATKLAFSYFIFFIGLTFLSLIVDSGRIVMRDFIELIKPVLGLLAFTSGYVWFDSLRDFKIYLVKPFIILLLIVASIGVLEATAGLDVITHVLYTAPRPVLEGKALSPFGITYFFATFMLLGCLLFLFLALSVSKWYSLAFFTTILALLLSQSRTLILSLAVAVFFVSFVYIFYVGFPYRRRVFFSGLTIILSSMIVVLMFPSLIEDQLSYAYIGIKHLLSNGIDLGSEQGSANIRVSQFIWVVNNSSTANIIGSGIGKGYVPLLESFYALYVYRYGAIGVMLYVFLGIFFLIMTLRVAKAALSLYDWHMFSLSMAMNVFLIVLPITSLSSVITDQIIFIPFYYGFLGFFVKYYYISKTYRCANYLSFR